MPDERTSSVQRHESPDGLTGRLKQLIREGKRLFLCAGGLGSESLGRVAESVRPPRAPTRSNTSWQGRGNGDRSHATDSLGHSVKPRPPDLTRRSVALGSPLERSDASANGRLAVSTPGQGRTMRARHWRASSESSVSFVVADVFEVPEGPLGRDAVDQSVLPSAPAGDGRAVAFIDQLRASVLTPWRRQNWWARTVCILALLTWGAYVQWPRWTLVLPALLAILLPWGNATWDALRHNRRSKVFERDRAPHATENAAATRRVPEEAHPPSPKRLPVGVSPRSLRTPDTSLFDASRDASFSEKRSLETSAMGKEANAASPQAVRGVDARFQSSPPRPPKATPAAFQELQPARIFHHVFSALGVESAQAHVPARPRTPTPSSSSLGEGDDDDVANEGDVPPIDIQSSSVTDDSRYETPDASPGAAAQQGRPISRALSAHCAHLDVDAHHRQSGADGGRFLRRPDVPNAGGGCARHRLPHHQARRALQDRRYPQSGHQAALRHPATHGGAGDEPVIVAHAGPARPPHQRHREPAMDETHGAVCVLFHMGTAPRRRHARQRLPRVSEHAQAVSPVRGAAHRRQPAPHRARLARLCQQTARRTRAGARAHGGATAGHGDAAGSAGALLQRARSGDPVHHRCARYSPAGGGVDGREGRAIGRESR
eukprot:ctg_1196.g388